MTSSVGQTNTALYHFTSARGRLALGDEGVLIPPEEMLDEITLCSYPEWQRLLFGIIWLTDLDRPEPASLGLLSETVVLDRSKFRYRVHDYIATRWNDVRRHYPSELVDGLESVPGVQPGRWWIALGHVPVTFDPVPDL